MAAESIIHHHTVGTMAHNKNDAVAENVMTVGIRSAWNQGLLLDFTVKVDGRDFHGNKVVLASGSDYFRTILTGNQPDFNKDSIEVEGVTTVAMESLISYIHTNQLDLTKENVSEVLAGARHLQIKSAFRLCIQFLVDNLDEHNWCDMLRLFRSYNLADTVKQVKEYVKTNIRDIVKLFDNGKLSYDDLYLFVDNWQCSEYDLFLFIKQWVHADDAERETHLNDLLSHVRYCLMTPIELAAIKELEMYRDSNYSWCHLVEKAVTYHQLPLHLKVLDDSKQTQVRSAPTFLTFANEKSTRGGYFYEALKERCLVDHEGLVSPVNDPKVTVIVNNFLIVGTLDVGPLDNLWFIFNPRSLEWAPMAVFPRDMYEVVFTHDKQFLYALGGCNVMEDYEINKMERYDFSTNSWSDFGKMAYRCVDFACAFGNGLYMFGGDYVIDDGLSTPPPSDIIESHNSPKLCRLDLTTHEWETKASSLEPTSGHTPHVMIVHGEEVMVIFYKSFNIEYYSPSKNQWTRCTFTLEGPYPERSYNTREWVRGNSLFIADVVVRTEFSEPHGKGHGCAIITYPESGTEVKIEYIKECKMHKYFDFCRAVLSFDPHTSQLEL